ncbi:hypothetical protein [Acetobacterium bakii]|uniref:Uncharacterized protein n=1 Tax=Acetobacterium bakii TaxID=52689 RepID=A0A0L6TWB1_9FIRM|nr:hypothetical protein [Acetobacterium bakii]KNZ40553.1 hypothetical protein AKG39_16990 [Acetobacterium bakii]
MNHQAGIARHVGVNKTVSLCAINGIIRVFQTEDMLTKKEQLRRPELRKEDKTSINDNKKRGWLK